MATSELSASDLAGKFVLIKDFWPLYTGFEMRARELVTEIEDLRAKMQRALETAVGEVIVLKVEAIHGIGLPVDYEAEFVVTLDGGVLFPKCDFRIEITRACGTLKTAASGPYLRLSRQFSPLLNQQVLTLARTFRRSGKRSIVLCDDGIGTGGTFLRIIELCRGQELPVSKAIAITNPQQIESIGEVAVFTLDPARSNCPWLNERDLFWGLPRSGLSISEQDQFRAIGGVPYTINENMAVKRVGVAPRLAEDFVMASQALNKEFFEMHERNSSREIRFADVSRLAFLHERRACGEQRIVTALEQLITSASRRREITEWDNTGDE